MLGPLVAALPRVARVAVALALALVIFPGTAAAVEGNVPTDSWIYDLVRELELRGHPLVDFGHARPSSTREIVDCLVALRREISRGTAQLSTREIWLLEALEREFGPEIEARRSPASTVFLLAVRGDGSFVRDDQGTDQWRGQGIGEASLRLGAHTTLYHRSWIDTRPEADVGVVGRPWKGRVMGVTDPAYILYQSTRWRFLAGRERMEWGPGEHGGLLLSSYGPPLDQLKAEARFSRFQGTAFTAVLDEFDVTDPNGDSTVRASRYLAGHRLAWRPCHSIEVAVSEVIVYGGENRRPEIRYLVPVFFFYGEQWNSGSDDNPFWSIDLSWYPRSGLRLYGEYLVDDFQYDPDAEPNEIGFMVGGEMADPLGLGGSVLGLEYARINRWTYGQAVPWNRYLNHGLCMGHPLGPDADGLWVRWSHQIARTGRLHVDFGRTRKGEGCIEDERTSVVPFPDDFPLGVVEKRSTLACSWEFFPSANRWFLVEIGWARTTNLGHVKGKDMDELTAVLRARIGIKCFRLLE